MSETKTLDRKAKLSFFDTEENQEWQKIRGWLLPGAAERMYQYAAEASSDGWVVEVGSFAGKSTVCIARSLKERVNPPGLFCIDIGFQSDFDTNIDKFEVSSLINKIAASSMAAADNWNKPISFLYIDGHHGKAHAYADFVVWETMVIPGGIVAFDDTAGFFTGPSLQIQAALRTGAYELLDEVDGVSFLKKKHPLVPPIGEFPLSEGSLMSSIIHVSAWSSAMDPQLRLPKLPKWQEQDGTESNRAKALERPNKELGKLEKISGLNQEVTQTILYLRGCIEMQSMNLDTAINIFNQLQDLEFSSNLIHYKVDIIHMSSLRLAQAYDLKEDRDIAESTYQKLIDLKPIPEIVYQAKLGLSTPFKLPAMSKGWLLREYVVRSPLAPYRNYFQSLQQENHSNGNKINQKSYPDRALIKQKLKELHGMTSQSERLHVYEYVEKQYSGEGEIVELGCWLGSSTLCMAMGLENNQDIAIKDKRIHVYDRFIWSIGWNQLPDVIGTEIEGKYEPGNSFLDEYMRRTQPWSHLIEIYSGDLGQNSWNSQKSIEYLFVDAMKSWELINSIFKSFFPYLIPGKSVVHHNDWAHIGQPGIHLLMYKLKDYFVPIYDGAPAMGFQYKKQIPNSLFEKVYNYTTFSNSEVEAAFNYAFSISPPHMYPMLFAAKVLCWIRKSEIKIAELEMELAKSKFSEISISNSAFARQFMKLTQILNQVKKKIEIN